MLPRDGLRIAAVVALSGLSLHTAWTAFQRFRELEPAEACPPALDARYARLRDQLPAAGVVGYVGPELTPEACNAKFLAQYSLAPLVVSAMEERDIRIVARNTDFIVPLELPVVIVDTRAPEALAWLRERQDYRIVLDAGDGLYLAARTQ